MPRCRNRQCAALPFRLVGSIPDVVVFLVEVTQVLAEWPEMDQRERRWLRAGDAATLISDSGIRPLLHDLERGMAV